MKKTDIIKKMTTINFFPGRKTVSFRRGPSGFLRQDPSEEAARIKNNPHLQDKSPPQLPDIVHSNAHTLVSQQGGDVSDRREVMGEYVLQFGKYKGKCFRWLMENDVGYVLYLLRQTEEEGKTESGPKKASLEVFLDYARSFTEILDLLARHKNPTPPAASEGDNLVGFGKHQHKTWREIWDQRSDGYAAFIIKKNTTKGSRMEKLQQYLLKQQRADEPTSRFLFIDNITY